MLKGLINLALTLSGILPDDYYNHLLLFIEAMKILYKPENSFDQIKRAHKLLTNFVIQTSLLYGNRFVTLKMHSLLHICFSVLLFGNVHYWSAKKYEDCNGILNRSIFGTNKLMEQVCMYSVQLTFRYSFVLLYFNTLKI